MKNVTYGRILLTHDGSGLASYALPHIVKLAQAFNSEVAVIQVIDSMTQVATRLEPVDTTAGSVIVTEEITEIYNNERQAALKNLNGLRSKLEEAGIQSGALKMAEGVPGEEIVYFAKEQKK